VIEVYGNGIMSVQNVRKVSRDFENGQTGHPRLDKCGNVFGVYVEKQLYFCGVSEPKFKVFSFNLCVPIDHFS
jgi:hypothetical protein